MTAEEGGRFLPLINRLLQQQSEMLMAQGTTGAKVDALHAGLSELRHEIAGLRHDRNNDRIAARITLTRLEELWRRVDAMEKPIEDFKFYRRTWIWLAGLSAGFLGMFFRDWLLLLARWAWNNVQP